MNFVKKWKEFLNEGLLVESRKKDAINKYPHLKDEIEIFSQNDPSGKNKYLMWMAEQYDKNEDMEEIVKVVNLFHKNFQRLEKKDIHQYKTADEVVTAIEDLGATRKEKKQTEKQEAVEGADIVHDDNSFAIMRPFTMDASIYLGRGMKWCISDRDRGDNYFDRYTNDGEAFYFLINKHIKSGKYNRLVFVFDGRNVELQRIFDYQNIQVSSLEDDMRMAIKVIKENLSIKENEKAEEILKELIKLMEQHLHENEVEGTKIEMENFEELLSAEDLTYIQVDLEEEDRIYWRANAAINVENFKWNEELREMGNIYQWDWKIKNKIERIVTDVLDDNNIYDVTEVYLDDEWFNISFEADSSEEPPREDDLDNFGSYLSNMAYYDRNFADVQEEVKKALQKAGYLVPEGGAAFLALPEELKKYEEIGCARVNHDEDENEYTLSFDFDTGEVKLGDFILSSGFRENVFQFIEDSIKSGREKEEKQLKLPGINESLEKLEKDEKNILMFGRSSSFSDSNEFTLHFSLNAQASEEEIKEVLWYSGYICRNYKDIHKGIYSIIKKYARQ